MMLATLLVAMAVSDSPPPPHLVEKPYDVVVYGGTAGGVVAAIAAANEGLSVALVEPGTHIGGMVSGGLGRTDYAKKYVIGGMSREFYERAGRHYGEETSWFLEPHVAEKILRDWLEEAGVSVHLWSRVGEVEMDGERVLSFADTEELSVFRAPYFIDASYEGDLMARAGVSYTIGREGREVYDESLAGKREYSPKHQFDVALDPYDAVGNPLPLIYTGDPGETGEGDRKVQAYNFRLCMTQVKENLVPWPRPEDYDPARWELLARLLQAKPDLTLDDMSNPAMMPNGKTDTNNDGPISTDYIGGSWNYPDASYDEREHIFHETRRYVQGFFYFLAHDPRVPEKLQQEINSWGLAKDEFTDTDNWPHNMYVREGRRMLGAYVMNQKDLQTERTKSDSIGMGSYNSDSHHVQRIIVTEPGPWGDDVPMVINEGDMQVPVQPYEIAYGALTPKPEECTNLWVTGCVSASHVAYSSIRMEPQYMIMGQAAGVAASIAHEANVGVTEIDIDALQAKLREHKSVLSLADTEAPYSSVRDFEGLVLDDGQADKHGRWRTSTTVEPFIGYGYSTTDKPVTGEESITFRPKNLEPGIYDVLFAYSPHPNRCKESQVVVRATGVTDIHTIDQTKFVKGRDPFVWLGSYVIKDDRSSVTVRVAPDTGGHLTADAVQWIKR